MEIDTVVPFVLGYQNGAQCSNIKAYVLVEYSGNFGDPALGAKMAQDMIKQGADVMFAAAGGTGVSAILTATQTGIWGIGVDFDFYYNIYGGGTVDGADKLLSSAIKRIDNAVYQTISDVVATDFTSGTIMYDLSVDGVSLAPFYDTESFVPQSVKDAIEATTQGIIDGTIDVNEDCRKFVYLPTIIKK
jgi:basic membrane protein A